MGCLGPWPAMAFAWPVCSGQCSKDRWRGTLTWLCYSENTANLIELAGDKGLLEPAFARRIRGMAGMRNAIVQVYWRLDYQAIYRAVTEELVDFDEFARQVQAYPHK